MFDLLLAGELVVVGGEEVVGREPARQASEVLQAALGRPEKGCINLRLVFVYLELIATVLTKR